MLATREDPPAPYKGPDGILLYAVGDIHGRADLLDRLLARIEADAAGHPGRPIILFLGDYVDRGADSRGVIERILKLRAAQRFSVFALRGNHDQYVLDFLETPEIAASWLDYGGAATLLSYGVAPAVTRTNAAAWKPVADALVLAMPPEHLDFLQTTALSAKFGDYVFAHAGVKPDVALEDQAASDLLSIRRPFIKSSHPIPGRVVVYGHTPCERPAIKEGKLGLDTGAYATGVLTAARIYESSLAFITT